MVILTDIEEELLKGTVSTQKALKGLETEMSEMLKGTKESKILTDEGLLINSSGKSAIFFYKRQTEKK